MDNASIDRTRTEHHRRRSPWQFSVASLLALMTFVAIALAPFRKYPALAIAIFLAAGPIVILLAVDAFASQASRQNWRTVNRAAWAFSICVLISIVVVAAYAIGKAVGAF